VEVRDSPRSRAMALIDSPCTSRRRRILPIVSTHSTQCYPVRPLGRTEYGVVNIGRRFHPEPGQNCTPDYILADALCDGSPSTRSKGYMSDAARTRRLPYRTVCS
jgi:hypothetical protein